MMKETLLLFVIITFSINSQASLVENYSIKGILKSKENTKVEGTNIIIYSVNDSSLITGGYYINNTFCIKNIPVAKFYVALHNLSYKEKTFLVDMGTSNIKDLGVITLENNVLKEVVVKYKKSPFEIKNGKSIVNVSGTSLSELGNAYDILKRSPKIAIDNNDGVSVLGKGKANVLINGRPVNSSDEINSLQSNEIKKIEILENPSAKYEASGNAVVNIILKPLGNGAWGSHSSYFTQGRDFRYFGNVNGGWRYKKFNVYGNFSLNPTKKKEKENYVRLLDYNSESPISIENDVETRTNFKKFNNYKFGTIYNIADNSNIGIEIIHNDSDCDKNSRLRNILTENGSEDIILTNKFDSRSNDRNQYILNGTFGLDTLGSQFITRFDYSNQRFSSIEDIHDKTFNENSSVTKKRNLAKSDIEMYSGGLEYLKKYGNSNSALTIGSLFKGINNDSKNIFEINNNAIWKQDDNLSQAYDYSENIQSGFLMFEKEFDNHISVNVGVRGEYSDISGGVENENSRIVDTTYFNFFPSFSISKDLSKKWNVNLSYSRRIGRPSLAELNPFVQYIDSISYFVGNPLLKPEYSNSFDLSLTYLKFASINLSYSHTEDPVFQYVGTVKQGQKTNTFVTSKNFNFSRKYNLSMVIPYRIGGFTTYNNIGVSHLKLNNNGVGSEVLELSDENLMVYGQSSNEFTTENNWTFDATYKYNSKGKNGLFEYNTRHILSLSVGKKFFDKKLKVRLLYNDVFRTSNIHSKAQLSNYKIRYTGDYDKSYVRLYISYSFHKKAKQKGLKSNLNEDFKRINRM